MTDTRKPWEKTSWTCARARVDQHGIHCPPDRCADCPNSVKACGFYDDTCERICVDTPAANCLLKAEMEYLSWLHVLRSAGVIKEVTHG